MKKRIIVWICLFTAMVGIFVFDWVFSIPENVVLTSASSTEVLGASHCSEGKGDLRPLDSDGQIQILVWNIYKENRPQVFPALEKWAAGRQLLLLQEVRLDRRFQDFMPKLQQRFQHVNAFQYQHAKNGVLTASSHLGRKTCAYLAVEPWLRLPKSSLISYYSLSNGLELAVANIHAINFSLGVEDYRRQLNQIAKRLSHHQGPIIFAGDFNSWNEKRLVVLNEVMQSLGLKEADYQHESYRKRFINGYPLDHIFFRGLEETSAVVEKTTASDHSLLLADFQVP